MLMMVSTLYNVNSGSEKDKTGSTSSTSVPEKESAPQPDVDNVDGE